MELIKAIPTSWPNIRVVLFRRADGFFQFVEQTLDADSWTEIETSGLFHERSAAEEAMLAHAEDIEISGGREPRRG
jgi:hypothetical protein